MRQIIIFSLLLIGFLFCTAAIKNISKKQLAKAILVHNKSKKSTMDLLFLPLAEFLAKTLPMSKYNKQALSKRLKAANMNSITPEMYQAQALTLPLVLFVGSSLLFALLYPFFIVVMLFVSIILYRRQINYVDKVIKEAREQIEKDLPHFTVITHQHLTHSHDIIALFEKFRPVCSDAFRREIDITLADMKTGSHENALIRMEGRTASAMVSQVVRGLLSVMRGESQLVYFEMLEHDFSKKTKEKMRQKAKDKPLELKPYTIMILVMFVVSIMTGLIMSILQDLPTIF